MIYMLPLIILWFSLVVSLCYLFYLSCSLKSLLGIEISSPYLYNLLSSCHILCNARKWVLVMIIKRFWYLRIGLFLQFWISNYEHTYNLTRYWKMHAPKCFSDPMQNEHCNLVSEDEQCNPYAQFETSVPKLETKAMNSFNFHLQLIFLRREHHIPTWISYELLRSSS